ncbi:MAG TPA: hypothetical protein VJB57_00660 [Dehalococcoidia bacterium]|nr:hypothetical protein [Dehalococcoidia bacterium]
MPHHLVPDPSGRRRRKGLLSNGEPRRECEDSEDRNDTQARSPHEAPLENSVKCYAVGHASFIELPLVTPP